MVTEGKYLSTRTAEVFYYSRGSWHREFLVGRGPSTNVIHLEISHAGFVPFDPKDQTKGRLFKMNPREEGELVAEIELARPITLEGV
jgi:hypothetical protein